MEGVGSYIDQALLGGILTALLLLGGGTWLLYAQNALWRLHLGQSAGEALRDLEEGLGLTREPKGFGPWLRSRGTVGSWEVRVELRGGAKGLQARLKAKGPRRVVRASKPLDVVLPDLDLWLMDALDLRHEE